jgi:hypothetical protein
MIGLSAALTLWVILQSMCILSLFCHFRTGVEAGMIDGTLAFRFWWLLDYINPAHAQIGRFQPRTFTVLRAVLFSALLITSSIPFVAAVCYLLRLLDGYRRGQVFGHKDTHTMRMLAYTTIATGCSPFFLAPFAHMIGMLKPVTGITGTMIGIVILGLVLYVLSHVLEVGRQLQREQETFL